MSKPYPIELCFDENGMITFDPYRCDRDDPKYKALFDEYENLNDRSALAALIKKKKWSWDCEAVGLYHADLFSINTKGNYPTTYYFR